MQNQNSGQIEHPDASSSQIMGILSIVFCGIIGLILGIISKKKATKALEEIAANPGKYSESSLGKLKTGKTCGTIGMVLGIVGLSLFVLYILFFVVIFGAAAANGGLQ
jgi:hypothetical protein